MSDFDPAHPISIALITYSLAATLAIIVLLFYTYKSRQRYRRKNKSEATNKAEYLEQLHRVSIPNRYEVNLPPPEQKSKLTRTRSAPLSPQKAYVSCEYDSLACRPKEHPTENAQAPLINHYEKPDSPSLRDGRQMDAFIEEAEAYLSNTDAANVKTLQDKLLLVLTLMLKQKNSKWHERIQSVTSVKHHYEKIINDEKDKRTDYDSEDEETYQKFVIVKKLCANDGAQSLTSMGSSDHLKFLVERKSGENRSNVEAPYLEAKRFKAKNDCPEQLRQLCQSQCPQSNVRNRDEGRTSADQIKSDVAVEMKPNAERSNSFQIRAKQVARALEKPPVPPKLRSGDGDVL